MISQPKICIKQAIIVEGKYDKIKLEPLVSATIIVSNGFRIFKDREKVALIRRIAQQDGIIILTDSDVAGFKLRSYFRSIVKDKNVTNIYIPQIKGKEGRKSEPSKEGYLGVEGMSADLLRQLFKQAGILEEDIQPVADPITRMDLYADGFIGRDNSSEKRRLLLKHLKLPEYLSTNSLLDIINRLITKQEYTKLVETYQDLTINN